MILTVHIDNRVISLGCYEKAELLVSSSIAVNPLGTADQYAADRQPTRVSGWTVCLAFTGLCRAARAVGTGSF